MEIRKTFPRKACQYLDKNKLWGEIWHLIVHELSEKSFELIIGHGLCNMM